MRSTSTSTSAALPRTRTSADIFFNLGPRGEQAPALESLSARALLVVVLPRCQVVDQRDQLVRLIAAAAGLADIGAELPIHRDEGYALYLIGIRYLVRLLQLRVDVEGVIRLGKRV